MASNVIAFKLWTENTDFDSRVYGALHFMQKTAGVYPLYMILRYTTIIAFFSNSDEAQMCRDKMSSEAMMDETFTRKMIEFAGDTSWLKTTRWITIGGLGKRTTREQIIDYIQQKGGIEINAKDIYLSRFDGNDVYDNPSKSMNADIECKHNKHARKLVKALNDKPLNGQKTWVQIKNVPKGRTGIIVLGNLNGNITKQEFAEYILENGKVEHPPKRIMFRSVGKEYWMAQIEFKSKQEAQKMAQNLNCSKLKAREIWVEWIGCMKCVYCGETDHHWRFCLCHLPNINNLPAGKVRKVGKPITEVKKVPVDSVDKLNQKPAMLTKKTFILNRELNIKKS